MQKDYETALKYCKLSKFDNLPVVSVVVVNVVTKYNKT
jgi:hypothetical protein